MAGKMEPLPGTADIWAPEVTQWVFLENQARRVFAAYGYGELRTPIFERTDLFVRGIGNETEVVQKEMYTFEDRGGRSLTLRPEGTAGVMRALANQGIAEGEEKRVFYMGPMFRGERPAAGRRRQFHQIGVEAIGRCTPLMDAENIGMLMHYLQAVGLPDSRLLLNSRGTVADRARITDAFMAYFRPYAEVLCEDCQRRLDSNIWRILDCKNEQCQAVIHESPAIPELLSCESRSFFDSVCAALDQLGVPYVVEPRLVRGLDYYEHTVFEVVSAAPHLGAQNAIAGGGRYRIPVPGLKAPVEGVGFALGMERLILARGLVDLAAAPMGGIEIYIAAMGDEALPQGLILARQLREQGWLVLAEVQGRSLKAQLRSANRINCQVALIIGEQELAAGTVQAKLMAGDLQENVPRHALNEWLRRQLGTTPDAR